jgi:hypothetical protein
MPVTFLRTPADYFGIQEAPAQPLFQQTRALADPAVQNQLNFQDQITALRQQRPLARTQAIQNEYNAIFENANRLRQQQEAAKQAEQAVGALVGIAGDQPDYLEKKRAIQSQFPMAALDQRVQSLFNDNDRIYTARQSVEARRQEERERQAAELTAAGIKDVNEAYRIVDQGLPAVGAAKYQLGGGGENARLKMIKSGLDILAETLKNTPEEIEESEGKYVPNPVRKTLLDKYSQYSTEYQNGLDRALFPQVKAAAGGAGAVAVAETPAPASFRDAMSKSQTDAKEVLKVDQAEVLRDLDDPAADENTFMMAIQDPNTSFEVKKKAAERMRQIADKPKKDPSLSRREVDDRKSRLMEMASQAEKQVRMYPEIQKYRKAWSDEKAKVEGWIREYADYMGYDPDNLRVSLARDEVIIPDPENLVTERGEFEKFIKKKYGDVLSKPAERLEPFKTREFAKELGMVPSVSSILKTPAPLLLLSPRFAGSSKTYGDVLDAYLEEIKKPVAAESAQGNVTSTPKLAAKNIKRITPISNPAPQ